MQFYQQKHLYLKRKLPPRKHIATTTDDKKNYIPINYKGISENTFKK